MNNKQIEMTTAMPTMKKSLLALAVAGTMAMSGGAYAVDLGANDEWADTTQDGLGTTIADPGTAMAVNLLTYTLTIDDTGDELAVGAITGTTGTVAVTSASGAAVDSTIASIAISGAGDVTLTNIDDGDGATLTVSGALSTGGALTLLNSEDTTTNEHVTMTVTGNLDVTGIVTVSANVSNKSNAILNLNGATVSAASYALNDTGTGLSSLVFTGTAAQTVTGTVAGAADGEGTVTVTSGTNLVTFSNTVGVASTSLLAINVGSTSVAGNAKFSSAVDATTITILTSVADDAVADFDAAVVGAVAITAGNASGELASASFAGDVTGATTLTGATSGATATATYDGTAAQVITGNVVATTDGAGVIAITNTHASGVTFRDDIGVGLKGLGSITIASGAKLTQQVQDATTDELTFDVVGNVDDGSAGRGGDLVINGGNATTSTDGDAHLLTTITGNTKLTTLTFSGGDAATTGVGGAITEIALVGTTDVTTYNLLGGDGGSDGAATGGVGGDIDTILQTGATTATNLYMTGGAGGVGVAEDASGIGGKGGEVGDTSNTFVGLVTATVNMTGGAGGIGGVGDDATGSTATIGGKGGAGGAVTVTDFTGGITGNLVLTSGAGANGGLGILQAGGIGGAGGAVTLTDITAGAVAGNVSVLGGTAGTGGVSGVAAGATGGAGGAVTVSDITAAITGNLVVTGAAGGTGGVGTGAVGAGTGGDGGTIATTLSADLTGNATITAGAGGTGGAAGAGAGAGGAGGTGSSVTANFEGGISGILKMNDGAAGAAGAAGTGTAGTAGTAGTVTVNLTGGAASTIGSVVATDDGEGTLVVNNSHDSLETTFTGDVGSSTAKIKALTLTNGNTTFSGNVYSDAITGSTTSGDVADFNGNVTSTAAIAINDGDATFAKNVTAAMILDDGEDITFDGTTAQTITGAITSETDKKGNITVSNTGGTVTFSNAVGVASTSLAVQTITLAASTTTVFDAAVGANALSASGAMTLNAAVILDSTLTTGVGSTITLGSAFKDGGATAITAADSTTTLNQTGGTVTVNLSNQFTTGSVVLLENTAALDSNDLASFTVTDTALVDYTAALATGTATNSQVKITAAKRTTAGIATYLGMSSAQTAALGQVTAAIASGDATASTAVDTILTAGGSTAVNATEQLNSDAGAAMGAAMAVTGGVNNVIAGRQANTKIAFNTLGKQSGVSTGDASSDLSVWAQVFTSDATQDRVDNIDGYTTDGQGLVVGWEAEKADSTFGLSLSFADTDVDGKSAAATHIDTSSVQGTIYGTNGSTDWMMAYASADNDTTRTINFGGLNRTATGNYNSDIIMAKAGYSFDSIEMGGVATLTPKADLSWTHINNDGYTETGATNLNLVVDSSSNDVVTARMGAEFAQRIESNGAVTIPRVSVMGGYDLSNDRAETTSTFTGGGSSFTTQGIDPSKASLELGVGVDHVSDDSTVSFSYNTNLKDGYNSDTASLTFKSKF